MVRGGGNDGGKDIDDSGERYYSKEDYRGGRGLHSSYCQNAGYMPTI